MLCIDEKPVQALQRTSHCCRSPGVPEKPTHDYIRHGTTTLFAALEVATGKVVDDLPAPAPPPGVPALPQAGRQGLSTAAKLHIVCDNYATNLFKCQREIRSAAMIFQAPTGFAPTPPVASPG